MSALFFRKILYLFFILFYLVIGLTAGPGILFAPGDVYAAASDEKTPEVKGPTAVFPETRYQFEPIVEGNEIKHDFIIENHGDAPLVIDKVRPD